jgi:periplasmic protein TonB
MNANIMPGLPKYGAAELLEVHQRFFTAALLAASLLEFTLVGGYHAWRRLTFKPPIDNVRDGVVVDLPPAPPVNTDVVPQSDWIPRETRLKPSIGTPVPVPDMTVDPESTIPTQTELAMETGAAAGIGDGAGVVYRVPPEIEIETPPGEFVIVERDPVCIHRVNPVYPETARLVGMEGTVFVKLWIDRQGKVRQVVLLKSDNPIFDQAVMDAAKQWVFTPAIMNAGPVAVWMSVPFHFTLHTPEE